MGIPNIKLEQVFDLIGEAAVFYLVERLDIATGNKYYVLKLDLIGRSIEFTKEEVDKKNLEIVTIEQQQKDRHKWDDF